MTHGRQRGLGAVSGISLAVAVVFLLAALAPTVLSRTVAPAAGPASVPRVIANISATPGSGPIPLTVDFVGNGSGSFPPYSYAWSFGDGSPGATGSAVSHTYRWTGSFVVNLTVTDLYGAMGAASITVRAGPPVLSASLGAVPARVSVGERTVLTVNVSGGVPPYAFAWSGLPQGCPTLDVDVLSCQPVQSGTFQVSVTVTDSAGTAVPTGTSLTVAGNVPPPPPPVPQGGGGLPLVVAVALVAGALGAGGAAGLYWRHRRGRAPRTPGA